MQHYELNPDQRSVALQVANKALRVANGLSTSRPGSIYIPNKGADGMTDGTGTWIGSGSLGNGGVAQWIGDTTPPGRPLGITASGAAGVLIVTWEGELEGGIPEDFAYVRVFAKANDVTSVIGDLATVGSVSSVLYPGGTEVEVWAVAYDAARNPETGELAPNGSGESDHVEVTITAASTELAQEALDAANAINQHFWSDENGVHVSTDENDAEGENNVLINALGILLRAAQNNLLSLTPTGIALYDGQGNADENVIATFTGQATELGRNSDTSTVKFCGGKGEITYAQDPTSSTKALQVFSSDAAVGIVSESNAAFVGSDSGESCVRSLSGEAYLVSGISDMQSSVACSSHNIYLRVNSESSIEPRFMMQRNHQVIASIDYNDLANKVMAPYVIESYYPPNPSTTSSYYGYRKYSDGSCDVWGAQYLTNYNFSGNSGQGHYYGATIVTNFPFEMQWASVSIAILHDPGIYGWNLKMIARDLFSWVAWKTSSATESITMKYVIHGWWKNYWS